MLCNARVMSASSIDSTRIQGVTSDYVNFSSFDAERGRMMSPTEVETARPVVLDEATDRLRAADRHDRDAFCCKIASEADRQGLDGSLVAYAFHEDDRKMRQSPHGGTLPEAVDSVA